MYEYLHPARICRLLSQPSSPFERSCFSFFSSLSRFSGEDPHYVLNPSVCIIKHLTHPWAYAKHAYLPLHLLRKRWKYSIMIDLLLLDNLLTSNSWWHTWIRFRVSFLSFETFLSQSLSMSQCIRIELIELEDETQDEFDSVRVFISQKA